MNALRRILRALRLAAHETQVAAGLSAAQLYVLDALRDGVEASLSELAVRTMTDRSSVAAVIDRLAERGLVIRGTARSDRRRAAIAITAAGRAVLRRSPQPPTTLLIAALTSLRPAKLAALAGGLTALAEALGVADEPAGMLFEDGATARRSRSSRRSTRGSA